MTSSYTLIANPSAGGGRTAKLLPRARQALASLDLEHRLVETTDIDQGEREALAASTAGEIPIVMSGDGMVGRIGGALAGSGTPMAVLPGGRGNDLARVLGIPSDPAEAAAIISANNRRAIDVGEANGVRFLCIASCGFDSDANRIANEAKLIKGSLVYAYAALRALIQWRPARFEITGVGGGEAANLNLSGYSVAIANSKAYGGGMFVAPDAILDDGMLDMVATGESSKLSFLRGLPSVFKGTHLDSDAVRTARAREFRIAADRTFEVYADGESITTLPATIRVLERALTIIAPPGPDRGP